MTPSRRAFLLAALATAAASPLVDLDRLLWVPGARTWFLPTLPPPLTTLEGQAEAFLRELVRLRNGLAPLVLEPARSRFKLGDVLPHAEVVLADQHMIAMQIITKDMASPVDRYIRPAAQAMAGSLAKRSTHCVPLPVGAVESGGRHPIITRTDPIAGLSIRAARTFATEDCEVVRIDILTGFNTWRGRGDLEQRPGISMVSHPLGR